VTVWPYVRWTRSWLIVFPLLTFLLGLELARHQPPMPYFSRWLSAAVEPLATFALALAIMGASIAIFIALAHEMLQRGTISVDAQTGVSVQLRGMWRQRINLPRDSILTIRAVPAISKSEDRFQGRDQPPLLLRITPQTGPPIELLEGRRPDSLTALATAASHALGWRRDPLTRNWPERQMAEAPQPASVGPRLLAYGADPAGATLEMLPDELRLSLASRPPVEPAVLVILTPHTLSCRLGDVCHSWNCRQIHWLEPLEYVPARGALAIVLEDGTVTTLFNLRPLAELNYLAGVVNGALALAELKVGSQGGAESPS
jgi:hypothetical protein